MNSFHVISPDPLLSRMKRTKFLIALCGSDSTSGDSLSSIEISDAVLDSIVRFDTDSEFGNIMSQVAEKWDGLSEEDRDGMISALDAIYATHYVIGWIKSLSAKLFIIQYSPYFQVAY